MKVACELIVLFFLRQIPDSRRLRFQKRNRFEDLLKNRGTVYIYIFVVRRIRDDLKG